MGCIADLDAKRAAGGCDAEVLIAETADQIKRLLRRLLLCGEQRVGCHLRLDRCAHVRRCAEEAIRGHESIQPLVRALEVVVLDVEPNTTLTVREIGKYRLAEKLLPQRLPESLDLAERLRMLRSTAHMRDPATAQQLLEVRRATPRAVLPALVGQDLARLAVLGDAAFERFDHQTRFLVVRHRPRHQEPRVVIHERGDVHALMPPKLEREDVALPELVRLRALEPPLRLVAGLGLLALHDEPLLVEDPPHRRLRDPESYEPGQHVAQPPCPPRGVRLPQRDELGALRAADR